MTPRLPATQRTATYHGGIAEAALRPTLEAAILAPSGHNTQPWLFRVTEDAVEIYADRRRALPVVDPTGRELTMSCGAALLNLVIALRHAGYSLSVEEVASKDHDLLARVRIGGPLPPTRDDERLFAAIPIRCTNRRPYEDRQVPASSVTELIEAAKALNAHLAVVTDTSKDAIAALVAEGDRTQASDPHFRGELAAWVHPNRTACKDGIPACSFGVPSLPSLVFPFILRTLDWGNGQSAKDRQLASGSPVLAVLWTDEDTPRAWLNAGQALERVLLTAAANGLSASFLNQPIEVPSLRLHLAEIAGVRGYPQLLLRIGYGSVPAPATPRRDVADVLLPRGG